MGNGKFLRSIIILLVVKIAVVDGEERPFEEGGAFFESDAGFVYLPMKMMA